MCRSSASGRNHYMETNIERAESEEDEEEISQDFANLGVFHTDGRNPWITSVMIDSQQVQMLIDTGSAKTIMSADSFKRLLNKKLTPAKISLHTYSGERLPLLGSASVTVQCRGEAKQLSLMVADVEGQPTILGRDWLEHIKLDWKNVCSIRSRTLEQVLSSHKVVFQEGLGTMKTFKATLHLKPETIPKFHKARPVPFAVRPKVEAELDRLEKEGVLEKVAHSNWGSPIVVVPKKGGRVRICGDYKVTINPYLDIDQYPLPKASDLFATLSGGKVFSKLDLSQAYHQMLVDEQSQELLTITTHKGLYRYRRLPYGVASAPAVFQRTMEQILQGIPGLVVFMDDMQITGSTVEEHLERLDQVLHRLAEYGLRLQKEKCEFLKEEVEFLGHIINKDGLQPVPSKVKAITEAPAPTNVGELRSYLGMVQYYARFLPNLATELQPLHDLLKDKIPWAWTSRCQAAFDKTKKMLVSAQVLAHYDSSLPVRLECDASSVGLGAVISHVMPDGSHRAIAFASRTLTAAERNYAQIEKEALGLVFGVKKFHEYTYGRRFTLVTDHKPLLAILGPKKGVPTLAAARMQRWALILAAYDYDLLFRPTGEHGNADMLSRLPLSGDLTAVEEAIFHVTIQEELPITAKEIAEATRKDPVLSHVWSHTLNGWPAHNTDPTLRPFFARRTELTVEGGVVLWGLRVIIPVSFQHRLLEELHEEHPGMVRMKALARSFIWWPSIDQDIEDKVRSCHTCTKVANTPPTAPLHPWAWPTRPWQRVHVDFAEYKGHQFLVMIDAHSKWPEIFPMNSTKADSTIAVMRRLFSSYGYPEEVVSDNGPQFTSQQFADFLRLNGVRHTRSAPYHPATNGAAERMVQVLKKGLKQSNINVDHQLANLLLAYRSTPHSTTGVSPAELFLKRQLRTRLAMVKPDKGTDMKLKQDRARYSHDCDTKRLREFQPGDRVAVRQFRGPEKWALGIIVQRLGPVAYMVKMAHTTCHVHVDHLIPAPEGDPPEGMESPMPASEAPKQPQLQSVRFPVPNLPPIPPTPSSPVPKSVPSPYPDPVSIPVRVPSPHPADVPVPVPQPQQGSAPAPACRRSGRARKPPQRLDL